MSAAREQVARAEFVSLLDGEDAQPVEQPPARRSILVKPDQPAQISLVRPRTGNGRLSLVKPRGK